MELSFKVLKQNLRIKGFVGTSCNALKTQIWTALIAMLLVRVLQLKSKINEHLPRFIALLRQQLLVYRNLWMFLDRPFEVPPRADAEEQSPSFAGRTLRGGISPSTSTMNWVYEHAEVNAERGSSDQG